MTGKLIVYAYNVLFGDAILVEVPDGGTRRFILIDVGNPLIGRGGDDKPLLKAIEDIYARTNGKIDLYVMSHEHMDHIQGLQLASNTGYQFQIDTVWMPASAEPNYYQRHPEAKKRRLELQNAVASFSQLTDKSQLTEETKMLLNLNARSTDDYVDFIRQSGQKIHYLHRGSDLKAQHPFTNVDLRILAPEEDSSVYYHSVPHFDLGADAGPSTSGKVQPLLPPSGVDGRTFYDLVERMNSALSEGIFAIDKAGNNTSLVFELTWQKRRLLFTGDAEQGSWQQMEANNAGLKPVDLFKIGHHGSRNAMPASPILDKILPQERRKQAIALLSTYPALLSPEPVVYSGVPDKNTVDTIKARTRKVFSTTDVACGKPIIVAFAASV